MSILNIPTLKRLNCELWFRGESVSANSPKAITAYGDVEQLLPFPGAGIGMFDGNGDYLAIPDSDDWYFGTNDFTIELWYCPTILPTSANGSLFEIRTTEYISPLVIMHDNYSSNANKYAVMFSWDWTADRAMKSTTLASVGRWDHVALVRQGSTFKLYVNGIAESTYNSSNSIGNSGDPLYIGGVPFRATESINGMLCDYRISKNIARYTANFTPPTQPFQPDSYTKLLLHFNRNDSTFVDSSPSAHTITAYGNATQLTSTSVGDEKQILPFSGAGIGIFDGTGDYLAIPDSDDWFFGTSDFTIEFFVNPKAFPGIEAPLFEMRSTVYVSPIAIWLTDSTYSNKYAFALSFSWNMDHLSTTIAQIGRWDHVALVRNGSNFVLYINGVAEHTYSSASSLANISDSLYIGGVPYDVSRSLDGYLSEFRISKGIARYTSNFTVPKRQLESDSNTKLLIHFNRNDTTFIDSSPSAHTITAYGNTKQLCSPCGSGVAYFDGTEDYLTTPDHANFDFGSGDFTIEFYVRFASLGTGVNVPVAKRSGTSGWSIGIDPSSKACVWCNSSYFYENTTVSANTWYHYAIVRTGSMTYLYRNGNLNGSGNVAFTDNDHALLVGYSLYSSEYLNGNLSELRISNVARYTAAFTPPTTPFRPDPYTKLLLHMDGVGDAFYDSSDPPGDNGFPILPDGVTVTPNGTFTSVKGKDGRNYLKFDGSTNYVSIQDCDAWYFGDNKFTICCWYKSSTTSVAAQIVGQLATNVTGTWSVRHGCNDTNQFGFYYNAAGTEYMIQSAIAMNDSTWRFLTVIRDGTSLKLYINNVLIITGTLVAGAFANNTSALEIGRNDVDEAFCEGNIKDLMIFKGTALSLDQLGQIYDETFIY